MRKNCSSGGRCELLSQEEGLLEEQTFDLARPPPTWYRFVPPVFVLLLVGLAACFTSNILRGNAQGLQVLETATVPNSITDAKLCGSQIDLQKVLQNNLGNMGPDKGTEGIIYQAVETQDGKSPRPLKIEIHALGVYAPFDASKNGLEHQFAVVNQPAGKDIKLKLSLKDADDNPLKLRTLHLNAYDFDEEGVGLDGVGVGQEFFVIHGEHQDQRTNTTQVTKQNLGDGSFKYSATQVGTGADNPVSSHTLTHLQKDRSVALMFKDAQEVTFTIGSTLGGVPRFAFFDLSGATECDLVPVAKPKPAEPVHLVAKSKPAEPMNLKPYIMGLVGTAVLGAVIFGLYKALKPLTFEERKELAIADAKGMTERFKELTSKEPVNWASPELSAIVDKLKANRHHVKALCGAVWNEWSKPGDCQVCHCKVDRKEKGLHCANDGHRICWACMCSNIDWVKLTEEAMKQEMEAAKK